MVWQGHGLADQNRHFLVPQGVILPWWNSFFARGRRVRFSLTSASIGRRRPNRGCPLRLHGHCVPVRRRSQASRPMLAINEGAMPAVISIAASRQPRAGGAPTSFKRPSEALFTGTSSRVSRTKAGFGHRGPEPAIRSTPAQMHRGDVTPVILISSLSALCGSTLAGGRGGFRGHSFCAGREPAGLCMTLAVCTQPRPKVVTEISRMRGAPVFGAPKIICAGTVYL
jgi:hypothetical protein